MSGGTVVPRHECPGGHFFQGDSHASDSCVFVKEFNTKILNVRVCVSVLFTMSISSGGTTCSFGDG